MAYQKGERGRRVTWIGVVFELDLAAEVMKLTVPQKMMRELLAKLKDWEGASMIGLRELRVTKGRLSWMAGILTRMRWAVSIFYGVVAAAEKDAKQGIEHERASKRPKDQRPKDGLVAVSRFELPRAWLAHLLAKSDQLVLRVGPLYPIFLDLAIVTDASPWGIGAILGRVDLEQNQIVPWAALEISLRKEDADWLGVEWGQASSQGAMEAWAILLAVRFWKLRLKQIPLLIRSDSTVALAMASKLSSPSPVINWIGAELALMLELLAHHLPGQLNVEADGSPGPMVVQPMSRSSCRRSGFTTLTGIPGDARSCPRLGCALDFGGSSPKWWFKPLSNSDGRKVFLTDVVLLP